MNKAMISKLKIKPGYSMLVWNAPHGYLGNTKADTKPARDQKYDFIQLFVHDRSDLEKIITKALNALKKDGLFWISYPKKSSAITTDISRDRGWESLTKAGMSAVSGVAIDDTWSALRFKANDSIKVMTRATASPERRSFTAVLEKDDKYDGTFVSIPFDVADVFGTRGQVKVKAWFDGYPYRGILANMGTGCHIIIMRKDIRQAIGKNAGEKITVEIERDAEERIVEVPDDLREALAGAPKAETFYNSLSYSNRKEYAVWITSAKRAETREKRLADTVKKLLQGKKNPAEK